MTLPSNLSVDNFTVLIPYDEEEVFFSLNNSRESLPIYSSQKKYKTYTNRIKYKYSCCKLKCCGDNTKMIMISVCITSIAFILFGFLGYTIGSGLCMIGKESFKACFLKPNVINLSTGALGCILVMSVGLCFVRYLGLLG